MNPESVSIQSPVPLGLTCVQPVPSHAGETSQHFQELWIRTTLGMYFHHKHNKLVWDHLQCWAASKQLSNYRNLGWGLSIFQMEGLRWASGAQRNRNGLRLFCHQCKDKGDTSLRERVFKVERGDELRQSNWTSESSCAPNSGLFPSISSIRYILKQKERKKKLWEQNQQS